MSKIARRISAFCSCPCKCYLSYAGAIKGREDPCDCSCKVQSKKYEGQEYPCGCRNPSAPMRGYRLALIKGGKAFWV